jgi:predicted RNase H-like nuclease (RuvC/YqgF family)
MNPLFKKLYKHKKTRTRDPNAPPPPTLLGQVKELKTTREIIDHQATEINNLNRRLDYLESKNRRLESYVEAIRSWVEKKTR